MDNMTIFIVSGLFGNPDVAEETQERQRGGHKALVTNLHRAISVVLDGLNLNLSSAHIDAGSVYDSG